MDNKPVFVRNIDPALWKELRIDALKHDQSISEWLTYAIQAKLKGVA